LAEKPPKSMLKTDVRQTQVQPIYKGGIDENRTSVQQGRHEPQLTATKLQNQAHDIFHGKNAVYGINLIGAENDNVTTKEIYKNVIRR
jgi:hypothetical protein